MTNYYKYSAVFSWTIGIVNDSDHPIIADLNLEGSRNLMYSTKGAVAKRRLEPNECSFMLHAMAGFGEYHKTFKHTV